MSNARLQKPTLYERVKALPKSPGVYIFKNKTAGILYVGKAKRLRDRVSSYFDLDLAEGSKTAALVTRIADFDYIEVPTEFDALVLEAELIKKSRPKYNIVLKDDKSYLYIVIRNVKIDFGKRKSSVPLVITARKTDILPSDITFGPYTDGTTAKYILKNIRKLFTFRDCSTQKFSTHHRLKRPCLFGDIGLCTAPCVNSSEKDLEKYREHVKKIRQLLNGGSQKIIRDLNKKMTVASKEQNYEEAAYFRDLIQKFTYITQKFISPDDFVKNPHFMDDQANIALTELQHILSTVSPLSRIECYDIANISGKEAVGSMVVASLGKIDKSQYRKFKIKTKSEPDDFEMMYEVLYRRFSRKDWKNPDLVIVDGGKGQVSAALRALEDANKSVLLAGLAKKEEILVIKTEKGFSELKYSKDNKGLQLLISLRDEAHRFAQSYHHFLRIKKIRG